MVPLGARAYAEGHTEEMMGKCKHEWRAGVVWFGCTPGARRQDFECVRCGARERRPFNQDAYEKGLVDLIGRIELELALRDDDGDSCARRRRG